MRDAKRQNFLFLLPSFIAMTLLSFVAAALPAQGTEQEWEKAAGGRQEFEVASVRANKSGGASHSNFTLDNGNAFWIVRPGDNMSPHGDLFSAEDIPLMRYISFAYKLNGPQELALRFAFYSHLKLSVPAWVNLDHYDIEARAPGPVSKDQMRLMLQSLLADRFKLAVHWEMRDAPVFALVLDKPGSPGPQLQAHPAADDCSVDNFSTDARSGTAVDHVVSVAALPIPCGIIARLPTGNAANHHFGGRNVTLAMLAESMPMQTGLVTLPRPVVDRTGLTGGYNFSLEWTPEDTSEVDNRESGGTFRDALKEQLGLRLKPENAPVRILVIDHVEQPSPN